jgi:hypothetical protein
MAYTISGVGESSRSAAPHVNYGWNPIERAPFDEDVALQVTDGRGGPYTLHWPCRLTASGWINSRKGNAIGGHASEVSSGGHAASSSGCATRPGAAGIGSSGYAAPDQRSLLIGRYAMAMAEHREPCDSRGSCTVLGAPGGEIPPGDSTKSACRLTAHISGFGSCGHAAPGPSATTGHAAAASDEDRNRPAHYPAISALMRSTVLKRCAAPC